jgi:DNA-binding CsgD family transcriptional regulator
MIRRALADASTDLARTALLGAAVEICLAAGRTRTAGEHARELAAAADRMISPLLAAEADRADGLVRLADGHPELALGPLRSAVAHWEDLGVPYELARTRAGVAAALRALGEIDVAEIELDAARTILRDLGATPDLEQLESLVAGPPDRGALSSRELEVLRLLATGRTNRSIADQLGLSERTIDRHVSNIFDKLDVSSRAAATAFAYEHGLA